MIRHPFHFDATIKRGDEFIPLQCRVVPDVDQDGHCDGYDITTVTDCRYGGQVALTAEEREMLETAAMDEQIDRAAQRDEFGQLRI